MISWICHICGDKRPDDKINVRSLDTSKEFGLKDGTMSQNVRYCNDNPDCIEKSKNYQHIKKKSLYEAAQDVVLESSEEEIDEIIRESGEDPKEIVKRGRKAIEDALRKAKKK